MIVVDTNILASLYFPGPKNKMAEDLQLKSPLWLAPPLWKSEFRNVTALYFRKGLITYEEGLETLGKAEELMREFEENVDFKRVFSLVKHSKCSCYDCEFVGLAIDFRVPLVTYDKLMLREFPKVAVTHESYLGALV